MRSKLRCGKNWQNKNNCKHTHKHTHIGTGIRLSNGWYQSNENIGCVSHTTLSAHKLYSFQHNYFFFYFGSVSYGQELVTFNLKLNSATAQNAIRTVQSHSRCIRSYMHSGEHDALKNTRTDRSKKRVGTIRRISTSVENQMRWFSYQANLYETVNNVRFWLADEIHSHSFKRKP